LVGHAAHMAARESEELFKVMHGNPIGRRPLGRTRSRCYNNKINLKEIT
jgi:hypothetical protein